MQRKSLTRFNILQKKLETKGSGLNIIQTIPDKRIANIILDEKTQEACISSTKKNEARILFPFSLHRVHPFLARARKTRET